MSRHLFGFTVATLPTEDLTVSHAIPGIADNDISSIQSGADTSFENSSVYPLIISFSISMIILSWIVWTFRQHICQCIRDLPTHVLSAPRSHMRFTYEFVINNETVSRVTTDQSEQPVTIEIDEEETDQPFEVQMLGSALAASTSALEIDEESIYMDALTD